MRAVWPLVLGALLLGCSSDPGSTPAPGMGAGTGGAPAVPSTGGRQAEPSSTGGTAQSGNGTGGTSSGGSGSGGTTATPSGGASAGSGGAGGGNPGGRSNSGNTGGNGGRAGDGSGGRAGAAPGGAGAAAGITGTATGGTGTGAGGSTHQGVWKVMPLGDSVTGSTCYPQITSKDLIAAGHTNFQLIGTVTNNSSCSGAPSVKSEGHGGYGVTFLPSTSTRPRCTKQAQGCGSYAELQTWAAEKPDLVLMHFATNDCWDGQPTQTILAAYLAVIAEFRNQNPNVIFFVSKIIPLTPALSNAANLNAAVTPAWATTNSTTTSPIHIIDHATGFDPTTDTADGVHPNPAGAQKMSTATVKALAAAGYF